MSRHYEDVKVERRSRDSQLLTHPCFGTVSVSEVTGRSVMFGSEIVHDRVIRIRVSHGQLERNLSSDWISEAGRILEFDLTHAQFSQMIASNSGRTTPVTLRKTRHGPIEDVKEIDRERAPAKIAQFQAEMRDAVNRVSERSNAGFAALDAALDEANITGKLRDKLKGLAIQAKGGLDHLPSTLSFILEQVHETSESVANDAKVGLEAYAMRRIQEEVQKGDCPTPSPSAPFLSSTGIEEMEKVGIAPAVS